MKVNYFHINISNTIIYIHTTYEEGVIHMLPLIPTHSITSWNVVFGAVLSDLHPPSQEHN